MRNMSNVGGPAPSGVSQVDPLPGTVPVQVAVVSGAAPSAASGGAASWGAEAGGAGSEGAGSGGAEPEGVEPGGAESEGAEPEGAESEGAESGGAEPRGAASSGGPAGASPRLSSQQLREWLVQRAHRRSGTPRAGKPGGAGAGGAAVTIGVGDPTEPGAAGAGGAGARVAGVGGPGAGGAGAVDPGAGGAGGTVRPRSYFVPLLEQVLGVPSSTGLTERREPTSRPISPVRTTRRAPRSRPPPVHGTHTMALRPSSVSLRVPLPAPPESSLPVVPDPESDRARAASPTVARLLATAVTDPSFECAAASALVAELLDFAAACRLDYASALVAESVTASPPSVGGECALGTDVLEDRQEDFECLAPALPRFASLLPAPEGDLDAPDIPTPRSYAKAITGFSQRQGVDYFHTFSPTPKMTTLRVLLHVATQRDYELHSLDFNTAFLQGSLHEEIWLRRPPGFTGSFPTGTQWSLRRPVYGLRQAPREWHDTLRTTLAAFGFVPSTTDPSLFLRTDTSQPPFYVLVYVDDLVFATADTEALTLVKSELQKRHSCTDLGELRSYLGLQITRDRARRTITLTQSHMVHQVLQRFGFQYSSPQLTPLSTSHSLSAPPSDESVEPSGPYLELVGCLMYLMTCTRPDLAYPLSLLARYVALGRHQKVHWDAAKRVLRYLCSTLGMGLVLGGRGLVVLTGHADASWVDVSAMQRSSCEAEIYAGAMAAQELCWLTYLLTDLGEQPRSPPVLFVDNNAMIALCKEHRLEHRTKHIALRYFLARELQQRCQLRLAYMATQANTADVFTKALPPGDHQRFVTALGLLALLFLTGLSMLLLGPPPATSFLAPRPARSALVIGPYLARARARPFLTPVPGSYLAHSSVYWPLALTSTFGQVQVLTDQGTEFQGEFKKQLEETGITHRRTSRYHPQSDGLTERLVQTVKRGLRAYGEKRKRDWDEELHWIATGYRFGKQAALRDHSPYSLLCGCEPLLPVGATRVLTDTVMAGTIENWVALSEARARYLRVMMPAALENLHIAQLRDAWCYEHWQQQGAGGRAKKGVSQGQEVYLKRAKQDTLDVGVGSERWRVREVRPSGVLVLENEKGAVLKEHQSNTAMVKGGKPQQDGPVTRAQAA
ncbi:unnamed protein product [Closterium sp. NIES-53]